MDGGPDFREIYRALLARFGPQGWWPGETPLEVCLGAVLTQSTSWGNVERALAALREATDLDFAKLRALSEGKLARLVRPAGFFRQKAERLKLLLDWLDGRCDGDFTRFDAIPTKDLRGELLALRGIGPETADSILLYALSRPVFVVDAYTRRVAHRHGWSDERAGYDELAALFTTRLPRDPGVYNEFHALFVRLGKEHCRKRNPRCHPCPLVGKMVYSS
ncbi:MAG TPA: endonuclease III domain-containing protein [bacterium]|nr:endonuclease III domain-containing protein [bacterium]